MPRMNETKTPAGVRIALSLLLLLLAASGAFAQSEVSYERLKAAADEPADWLMY